MGWSCRKAACVEPRDPVARRQTAPRRRSDQCSRWMVGMRAARAFRPKFISGWSRIARNDRRRQNVSRRHAHEKMAHAGRHDRAFLAIDGHCRLRMATRHDVRRRPCHQGGRQAMRHALHRHVRHHRRHGRSIQRSQYETRDNQNRENPAYGQNRIHDNLLLRTPLGKRHLL
jgi:hypothetical protein